MDAVVYVLATGRLLQTPAEILHDVLAHLAGAPVQWADFDDYRTETAEWVLRRSTTTP